MPRLSCGFQKLQHVINPGHASPATWCLKDTTKSTYYNEILIMMPGNRQYIFEFLPLFCPAVLRIPL